MARTARRYASETQVPVQRSREQISALLRQHGATTIATLETQDGAAAIAFTLAGQNIRLELKCQSAHEIFEHVTRDDVTPPRGWLGWTLVRRTQWCKARAEQIQRQRWRALMLVVKAKLEWIAEDATTVQREFLSDVVLPNGSRVGDWAEKQLDRMLASGKMPPLLPAAGR